MGVNYKYKLFQWENGAKSTDWTKYLTFPIFIEDRLDETLDTGQVTLDAVPTKLRKEPFAPKTKFRLEKYLSAEETTPQKYWDMIVEKDEVEQHVGVSSICTHRVHLIEASAVAQGMHCDNIALTYELQDVSLNYRTVQSSTDTLGDMSAVVERPGGHPSPIHENPPMQIGTVFFRNSYRYIWRNSQNLRALLYEQHAGEAHTISFIFPTLMAQGPVVGGTDWMDICEMETRGQVIRRHFRGSTLLNTTVIVNKVMGPIDLGADTPFGPVFRIERFPHPAGLPVVPMARPTIIRAFGGAETGFITNINNLPQFSQNFSTASGAAEFPGGATPEATISRSNPNAKSKDTTFTTDVLSEAQLADNERYTYEIRCEAIRERVPVLYQTSARVWTTTNPFTYRNTTDLSHGSFTFANGNAIYVDATMHVRNMATDIVGSDFLVRPRKYNCFDMIRKSMLTCGTKVFDNLTIGLEDIEYPIDIDPIWANRLKATTMLETIFEQKNLWEVLLQVGHYLHAIPYLEYSTDGTDRFVLKFRQLGSRELKDNPNKKITVFNSQSFDDFFTQYDSYVANLFSPQNLVEEWVVPKTSDRTFLISNNTAEVYTKFPILEIVEFNIIYGGEARNALEYVFERSIYDILTPAQNVWPSKAAALYYTLGDNKIVGLNYTPPAVNNDAPFSFRSIISAVFGIIATNIRFNDFRFHIKYRTQAQTRVSMVRPDLHSFAKNSSLEQYPSHNQFFGQQDKIVDSERYSANLWGRLIRVANITHQHNEMGDKDGGTKYVESGDLVEIDGEPYYIMSIENEFYPVATFQKVTYSKNFNQLSNIVTIPSEPRFFEVSERSQVRREVLIMDFLMLSSEPPSINRSAEFLNANTWRNFVRQLIFSDMPNQTIPNFAYTRFRADHRRQHLGQFGQVLPINELFPSVETQINPGTNSIVPRPSSSHRDVIVPLMRFPLKNAISFVWRMEDNFKAGDSVDTTISGNNNTIDDAYFSQQPVRYCDIMGRADLFEFRLFNRTTAWTIDQTRRLPFAEEGRDFIPTAASSNILSQPNMSVGLDKDNREAISFNYQLNLLTENNDLITFSNLFGQKYGRLKMCFLSREVSLFDEVVVLTTANIIADQVEYSLENSTSNSLGLIITPPIGIDLSGVSSIVLYDEENYSKFATIAKNVGRLSNDRKLEKWYIFPKF